MKAMFIAAHPDDIEFGCAGTICRLKNKNYEIYWVLMTQGENDLKQSGKIRIEEVRKSAHRLGIEHICFMNFNDGEVANDGKTVRKIVDIVNEIKPDIVFTHYYNDRHQDHRNTAYSVRAACWGMYNIIYFNSFSSIDFQPNLFVDIDSNEIDKIAALNCYASQVSKYMERNIDFIGVACAIDKKNGGDIHCENAEGFQLLNCVWNI